MRTKNSVIESFHKCGEDIDPEILQYHWDLRKRGDYEEDPKKVLDLVIELIEKILYFKEIGKGKDDILEGTLGFTWSFKLAEYPYVQDMKWYGAMIFLNFLKKPELKKFYNFKVLEKYLKIFKQIKERNAPKLNPDIKNYIREEYKINHLDFYSDFC